jgi:MFS family permease
MQGAVVIGPALGGAIYGAAATLEPGRFGAAPGAVVVYLAALVMLLLSVGAVALLRHRSTFERTAAASWASVTAGLRFIWQRPVMLGAISLDLFAVLLGGATALLPIFAKDILEIGPQGLGLLRAAPAAGAAIVGLVIARRGIERHAGAWLLGAVAVFGLSMIGFGLARAGLVMLALSGAADMISVVIRQYWCSWTPEDMRGRVGAVNSVFIGASNQLGEFESGATAAARAGRLRAARWLWHHRGGAAVVAVVSRAGAARPIADRVNDCRGVAAPRELVSLPQPPGRAAACARRCRPTTAWARRPA